MRRSRVYYIYFYAGAGDLPDGVHNDRNPPVLGLGLDPIKIRPNFLQILYAMLRLRVLRLFRNIQLLYFTIVAPLALIIVGLYINSIQTVDIKMQSLQLNSGIPLYIIFSPVIIKLHRNT